MSQELIITSIQKVTNGIGVIPGNIAKLKIDADKAEATVTRAIVNSASSAKDATTFIKSITACITAAEATRLSYTGPLSAIISEIKASFDEHVNRLKAVKATVYDRLGVYMRAEQAIENAKAAAERERQSAAALALVSSMSTEDAEEIIDLAEQAAPEATTVKVVSDYGAQAGLLESISGEVPDGDSKRLFLAWAAANFTVDDMATIKIGKRTLNAWAKKAHETKTKIPGLTVTVSSGARVV